MSASRPSALIDAAAQVRADRITAVGAHDVLERLRNAALLNTGVVNVIGLDAISRKLGDRWPHKRAQIWEHVERELERTLSPADTFLRTDDFNYLIAQPGAGTFVAQSVCVTILQDVLKFFLGEIRPSDIDVRCVSSLSGGQLVSTPVDLSKLRRGPPAPVETPAEQLARSVAGPLADHAPAAEAWKPPLAGRFSLVALAPPKREPFDVKLQVEGVWNLRRALITSFLIERIGVRHRTEAIDLEEVDVATVAYAATVLEEHASQGGPLTLHVPISFASLATQRTRQRLLRLTQSVRESMRHAVLIEICGLDAGVPPSRLIEVVGLVRSLCVGVIGRVRPSKAALEAVRGCGLRGLAIEADLLALQQPNADARLKAFVAVARSVSPNLLIHNLPDAKLVDLSAAAGFSHASVASE